MAPPPLVGARWRDEGDLPIKLKKNSYVSQTPLCHKEKEMVNIMLCGPEVVMW